jgi:uncharacterized membrane protein YkoI
MKTKQLLAGALAGTVALAPLAFAAGATPAQLSAAVKEDRAQLKADDSALARDEARLRADQDKLRADTRSGRMSAMSDDAEKIYKDRQYVEGQEKDIARDNPGSLQMKSDREALRSEERRLAFDQTTQRSDARAGRMSAMSDDGERVYRDRQAVKAEERQILADRAKLTADKNEWIAAAERHVQGKAVSAVLENGNGRLAYKVEVLKGDRLFDVTVHSREGSIVSAAVDRAGGHGRYGDNS